MDRYDEAIAYFTANPDEIYPAWNCPNEHPHGKFLFGYLCADRENYSFDCPSIVKCRQRHPNPEILSAVVNHPTLPTQGTMFNMDDGSTLTSEIVPLLPAFAEIQRIADRVYNRPL